MPSKSLLCETLHFAVLLHSALMRGHLVAQGSVIRLMFSMSGLSIRGPLPPANVTIKVVEYVSCHRKMVQILLI